MKKPIITILLLYSVVGFSQEKITEDILQADSTWFKEIIKFPINFAREIPYQGFEELRFAPGFSKQDTPELWSYTWAWVITNKKTFTEKELETNIQLYFDGLLGLDPKHHKNVKQQTNAVFIKKDSENYIGKIRTFDTRYTKKTLTLNVTIEKHLCTDNNRVILVFRLSPQNFESPIWKSLNAINLKKGSCD